MLHTALTLLELKSAQNSRDGLNPHKSNCPAKTPSGLVQIAVSTMLAPNLLQAELCQPSTVDTAL
jgi:hypothetical protein